ASPALLEFLSGAQNPSPSLGSGPVVEWAAGPHFPQDFFLLAGLGGGGAVALRVAARPRRRRRSRGLRRPFAAPVRSVAGVSGRLVQRRGLVRRHVLLDFSRDARLRARGRRFGNPDHHRLLPDHGLASRRFRLSGGADGATVVVREPQALVTGAIL